MRIDALAIRLRPRPMFEAADLGLRIVQANARSVWRCYAPLWLVTLVLALATVEIATWLPVMVLFMAKPWLDRTLLFVMSRAVFGESTRWSDVVAAQREVWWRRLLSTFTLRRLSPWRSYTEPLRQLEGQRGGAMRKRRALLLRDKRGSAGMMHLAYAHIELVLVFGLFALAAWLAPGPDHFSLLKWLEGGEGIRGAVVDTLLYAGVVLLLEPFYVASGFAMYLNRRVELEAWDIEREFRHVFAA